MGPGSGLGIVVVLFTRIWDVSEASGGRKPGVGGKEKKRTFQGEGIMWTKVGRKEDVGRVCRTVLGTVNSLAP